MKAAKIPPTDSIAELAHFWDTHDLTDFEEQLEVVNKPVFAMKGRLPDMPLEQLQVVMEEVTDPDELAKAQAQRQRFESNFAWFQVHTKEIYQRYRGKSVCIAGQELFVADDSASAWALGEAAHPEDDGSFVQNIPLEKVARIYANRWCLDRL